jgi:hypothetical protein
MAEDKGEGGSVKPEGLGLGGGGRVGSYRTYSAGPLMYSLANYYP